MIKLERERLDENEREGREAASSLLYSGQVYFATFQRLSHLDDEFAELEWLATWGQLGSGEPKIGAETAQGIAEGYLIDHVGDLLGAGTPRLSQNGYWLIPITLSNARRGEIGQVGELRVDAETGEVLFSADDRTRVKASARLLVGTSSP